MKSTAKVEIPNLNNASILVRSTLNINDLKSLDHQKWRFSNMFNDLSYMIEIHSLILSQTFNPFPHIDAF